MKQGGKEYNKFLKGERLTRKEAMLAQCYVCNGEQSGDTDCFAGDSCPLYQFMPYRKKRGKKRVMTKEAKEKVCKNLEKVRRAKNARQ